MKKSLLLLAASTMTCGSALAAPFVSSIFEKAPIGPVEKNVIKAPAFAEGETPYINFTYADDIENAYALNDIKSGYVYVAFQIPVADQAPYIGNKITGMNVIMGATNQGNNRVSKIYGFVTDDLSTVPATTEASVSTSAYSSNSFNLDTPFEITGEKPIYVGYRFKYVSGYYYLPVDEVLTPANVRTCLVANTKSVTAVPQYSNWSDQIGSIGISAKIEGDNLPQNLAEIKSVDINNWFALNAPIAYDAYVKNNGVNDINSLKVKSVLSNGSEYEKTIELDTPIKSGFKVPVTVDGISNNVPGIYTLSTSLSSVNSAVPENPKTVNSTYTCYTEGFPRKVVIEEATGNWCQYCPLGIATMEYFKEKYPDWILIAVHGGSSTEPMLVPGYNGFLNDYISGFPQAIANRFGNVELLYNQGDYDPVNDYFTSFPAYCDIDLSVEVSADKKSANISSTTKFSLSTDVKHYLSFVIVEDNVGPYSQNNAYYGQNIDLGGWENVKSGSKIKFNEVARAISGYPGNEGSLPAQIEKDQEYTYSLSMPLEYPDYGKTPNNIKGTYINRDAFRVVGMIVNAETNEIVNAKQFSAIGLGVDSVTDDQQKINIKVVDGDVVVDGTDNFSVYTLDGRKVSATGLESGVYVVKAENKTLKVLVK